MALILIQTKDHKFGQPTVEATKPVYGRKIAERIAQMTGFSLPVRQVVPAL